MNLDYRHGYDDLSDSALMAKVIKGWKCDETPCGNGSTIENTRNIRSVLPRVAKKYDIYTVLDAGAGDLHWMPKVEWDVSYYGVDLYPRHPDVEALDIRTAPLPAVDLIVCRHVLNHLSIRMAGEVLANFVASGSKYLLLTSNRRQERYWEAFDFQFDCEVVESFDDVSRWRLDLYQLQKDDDGESIHDEGTTQDRGSSAGDVRAMG